jgi:integrase
MTKVLTQRGVETIKPRSDRFGKADGLIPGLQLLVHPSGRKSFALFPRVHGKQIKITIGDAAVLTLAQAREKAKRKLALIASGEDPRAAKQEAIRTASETVEAVARRFIERHVKPNLRRSYEVERQIEREIVPRWGKRPITSIVKRDVVALLDDIVDRGSLVMANRMLSTLRRLFNWAIDRGLIETSPCDRIKPPASEIKRDRAHGDAELALIWRATETLNPPFGAFIRLLILTGQRCGEVAGMRWSELDPGLQMWTLPAARVKNRVQHQIPLAPEVRDILAGLPRIDGCDLVFTTNGRTSIGGFARIKAALDKAVTSLNGGSPIPKWVVHDFRRSAASGMARLGVQLPVVEKILNHVSGSFAGVAGIYQRHDFAGEKRTALEIWGRHVLALTRPPERSNVVELEARA